MGIIDLNLERTNLINKRDSSEYISIVDEVLHINPATRRAKFHEAIAKNGDVYTSVIIKHNGTVLTEGESADYILINEAATITINAGHEIDNAYTATYTGAGSIIWADEINELQSAVVAINTAGFAKDGSVTMTGDLDLGNNNIINVNTVNNINLGTHNHTNGEGGLITENAIIDNAISTAKIKDGAITENKLATNSVTSTKIATNTITTSNLNLSNIMINESNVNNLDIDLESKANRGLTNLTQGLSNTICDTSATTTSTATRNTPAVVVENYYDNTTSNWYRVWSDGWCEQGGTFDYGSLTRSITTTLSFLKTFVDTNYCVTISSKSTNSAYSGRVGTKNATTTGMIINWYGGGDSDKARYIIWKAEGYITGITRTTLMNISDIPNGTEILEQVGDTITLTESCGLEIEMSGGKGRENDLGNRAGGKIIASGVFSSGDVITVKKIKGRYESYGIGLAVFKNDTAIAVAGGGGTFLYAGAYPPGFNSYGGSGYLGGKAEGGAVRGNGYSIDGTVATTGSTDNTNIYSGQGGGTSTYTAFGGSGYLDTSIFTDGNKATTRSVNMPYIKIIKITE